MKITFKISANPIADGNYQPEITLVKSPTSASKDITGFVINEVFPTREEALNRAKTHAIGEARKQYGPNTEINIEYE